MLETTVIGSMPVWVDSSKYAGDYLEKIYSSPYPRLIDEAVKTQVTAGIDIVSDGQTR